MVSSESDEGEARSLSASPFDLQYESEGALTVRRGGGGRVRVNNGAVEDRDGESEGSNSSSIVGVGGDARIAGDVVAVPVGVSFGLGKGTAGSKPGEGANTVETG
ncbi:MAG TPA: hypothetical protein VGO47_09670, partial [Chlamydiales bacterium]|nr:hypothetical protein [Chlamydiales bacterium]